MNVLLAFVITMIVLLVVLIKCKVSPGVALFACAVLMALLCGMPLTDTLTTMTGGFGSIMTSIGLLILFGGIFGAMLGDSGGMEELAKGLLRTFGKKNDMLALNLAGFIVSIPVYFGSAYITFSPLVTSLQKLTKKKTSAYVAALFTGLLLTHCIVAPTPGPLAVAGQIGANVGWFIIYGIIVSLPASLLCGWQYANILNKKLTDADRKAGKAEAAEILNNDELIKADPNKPSAGLILALIAFFLCGFILKYTKVGTYINAIGTNELTAKNMGVDVDKYKFIAFILCSGFVGIMAVLYIGYGTAQTPMTNMLSQSLNFTPLMGAFFGLAFKKYGHPVVAIVIGELIISMMFAGFVALGMPTTINNVVTGATLLIVVTLTVKRVKGAVVK